jgi:hypothetical protein
MKVKQFIEAAKLDWSDFYFDPDGGSSYSCPFQVTPEDFITFAKADFFNADAKGLVNALSNAKRAVDCQADSFLVAIGLNPERLDKQLSKDGIRFLNSGHSPTEAPLKFRLLQALGFATPAIIARMRRLRNLLEHEYKKPRKKDVSDAIDVAELFVHACRGKMKSPTTSFGIGSGITDARGSKQVARSVYIQFKEDGEAGFELRFWDQNAIAKHGAGKSPQIIVQIGDVDFVPLLKLTWQADLDKDMTNSIKTFLTEVGVQFPAAIFRVHTRDFY